MKGNTGNLTADGSTAWFYARHGCNGVSLACKGDFGGGTITVEEKFEGSTYTLKDSSDADITKTGAFNLFINLREGDFIRLTLSDSTDPDLNWKLNGLVREETLSS